MATASYPKSLSYMVKMLAGGFSRTGVKISADRTTGIKPNDYSTFKLPNNSLVDLRTLCMFFQLTTSASTGTPVAPRYTSSFVERLAISINGQTIQIINSYNLLYNLLMDLEGSSLDQMSKRSPAGELFDPSVNYTQTSATVAGTETAISASNNTSATATKPNKLELSITHWLSILGSSSTNILDTGDLGDVLITVYWAPSSILPMAAAATAQTFADVSYTLDDLYATVDVISFSSDEYYRIKESKINNGGIQVGFYDYYTMKFAKIVKSAGISVNFNVNCSSLDQLIGTAVETDQNTNQQFIGYGTNDTGATSFNMAQILADPVGKVNNTGTTRAYARGDAFFNSVYFKRNLSDIIGSVWAINNRNINYGLIKPKEIYLQTMIALGYNHTDLGTSGVHPNILSIFHYLKYHAAHIIDLTCQNPSEFYISGLDGRGASLNITWNCTFPSTCAYEVVPMVFARCSKVMTIYPARQITID